MAFYLTSLEKIPPQASNCTFVTSKANQYSSKSNELVGVDQMRLVNRQFLSL